TFAMNSGTFNFGGGTVSGSAVLLQSLLNNTASSGIATFNMQGESSTLSGNIVANETVIIEATGSNHATVTAASSLTNSGEIRMIATGVANNSVLVFLPGSTLTNAAGGLINVNPGGAGGGFREISADLNNLGSVNINTNATIDKNPGTTTNQGSFMVANAVTLSVNNHTFT